MGWWWVSCHVLTRETKSGPILESDYTNTHTKAGIRRAATKSKTRRSKQQINHSPPRLAYLLSTHLNPPPRTATTGTALLSADKRGSTSLLAVSPNTHTTHTPNTRNTHTTTYNDKEMYNTAHGHANITKMCRSSLCKLN